MMRKVLFTFVTLSMLLAVACKPDNSGANGGGSTSVSKYDSLAEIPLNLVAFEKDIHNFGTLKMGEKVKYAFKFTNTSDEPLKIELVKPSCSCTVGEYTQEVIPPGGKGFVSLEYDSNKGSMGKVQKFATVYMNTKPKMRQLVIEMEVVE